MPVPPWLSFSGRCPWVIWPRVSTGWANGSFRRRLVGPVGVPGEHDPHRLVPRGRSRVVRRRDRRPRRRAAGPPSSRAWWPSSRRPTRPRRRAPSTWPRSGRAPCAAAPRRASIVVYRPPGCRCPAVPSSVTPAVEALLARAADLRPPRACASRERVLAVLGPSALDVEHRIGLQAGDVEPRGLASFMPLARRLPWARCTKSISYVRYAVSWLGEAGCGSCG